MQFNPIIVLFFLFFPSSLWGTEILSFPKENEFYSRDSENESTVKIEFKNNQVGNRLYFVSLVANNDTLFNQSITLSQNQSWSKLIDINAGLLEYNFFLYESINGTKTLVKKAEKIICGDLYVIYGQSNGSALYGVDDYSYTLDDRWIRNVMLQNLVEPIWYRGKQPNATVGVLGLWLAKNLVLNQQIPICIINGSEGGQNITNLSLRNNNNPKDQSTFYGKLLARVIEAKTLLKIKGFIWFQGEAETSSGINAMLAYGGKLDILYANIVQDFPPIDKFILMQINLLKSGIGEAGIVRNIQANFRPNDPKVVRLATVGQSFWYDGVHYGRPGYETIAEMIHKYLANNLYSSIEKPNFSSPRLQKVIKDFEINRLRLIFEDYQEVSLEEYLSRPYARRYINPYVYINGLNHQISKIENFNNEIRLELNNLSTANSISFLPSYFTDSNSPGYDGPVIKNVEGFSALTFTDYQIEDVLGKPTYDQAFYKERKLFFKLKPGIADQCTNCILKVDRKLSGSATFESRPDLPLSQNMIIDSFSEAETTSQTWNYRIHIVNDVSLSDTINFDLEVCANLDISLENSNEGIIRGKKIEGDQLLNVNISKVLFDQSAILNPGFRTNAGQVFEIERKTCSDQ